MIPVGPSLLIFVFSFSVLKLPGTSKTVQLVMLDTTMLCCRRWAESVLFMYGSDDRCKDYLMAISKRNSPIDLSFQFPFLSRLFLPVERFSFGIYKRNPTNNMKYSQAMNSLRCHWKIHRDKGRCVIVFVNWVRINWTYRLLLRNS